MSVAQRLTIDVLFLVLSRLSPRGLVLATHVCAHWRNSAVILSLLWTDISDFGNKDRVTTFLERAKSAPVELRRVPVEADDDALLELIVRHLYHTRTLELLFRGSDSIGCGSHGLRLFQTPAPTLEVFIVDGSSSFFDISIVPNWADLRIFGGKAPSLHSVSVLQISNVRGLLARLPQPEAVRDIRIDYGETAAQINIDTTVATMFPNAVNLHVSHGGWRVSEGAGDRTSCLGSLTTLHLHTSDQNVVDELIQAPMLHAWSRLKTIYLDVSDGVCKTRFFNARIPACGDEPYKSIEITAKRPKGEWERARLCIRAVTPSGRVRVIDGFHPNHLESLLRTPEAARQLEELRLDACGYRVASMFNGASLMALRVLRFLAGEPKIAEPDLGCRWVTKVEFQNFIEGIGDTLYVTPNLEVLEFQVSGQTAKDLDTNRPTMSYITTDGDFWSTPVVTLTLGSLSPVQAGAKIPIVFLRGFTPQAGLVKILTDKFAERVIATDL